MSYNMSIITKMQIVIIEVVLAALAALVVCLRYTKCRCLGHTWSEPNEYLGIKECKWCLEVRMRETSE